jgi:hypothetical protein
LLAAGRAGNMGRAPAFKKMLKMKIDPDYLLKTKGEKITDSGDPDNCLKTKPLTE